jgi:parvulin-like peptidyl-prolyl isomerase
VPKKKAPKVVPKSPMTKKQLSRHQKEQRQQRLAIAFVAAVVVLIVGVLGFGLFREFIYIPSRPIAVVNGVTIPVSTYAKVMAFRQLILDQQINFYQSQATAVQDSTQQSYLQMYQQQLQSMRMDLGLQVPEDLIEEELIRQEAVKRGLTVTAADVEAMLAQNFTRPTSTVTETTTITGTATATPIPTPNWQDDYKSYLSAFGISDADYRQLVVEPEVYREKLSAAIGAEVATTAEQVHVRHILVDTYEAAVDIVKLLQEGGDFAAVAQQHSTDSATKDTGGDMGWRPRGIESTDFDQVAFALQPGQISNPITTTNGVEIIKLEERDPNRPLEASHLETFKSQAFNNWVDEAKKGSGVQRAIDSDKMAWATKQADALNAKVTAAQQQ